MSVYAVGNRPNGTTRGGFTPFYDRRREVIQIRQLIVFHHLNQFFPSHLVCRNHGVDVTQHRIRDSHIGSYNPDEILIYLSLIHQFHDGYSQTFLIY